MNTTEKLKAIAAQLRELFPTVQSVDMAARADGRVSVTLHGLGDYAAATRILQHAGYHERQKQIVDADSAAPWVSVSATDGDNFEIKAFASGLPPSCRLEKKVVRIPKQETRDTGEFIEVERLEVVCGNGEAKLAGQAMEKAT